MRRLYFLVPDIDHARKIVDELLLVRVNESNIHVIAREDTPLEDLPEAGLSQKSDLIPALERGLTLGGITGALVGLVAVTIPPAGLVLGGGAVLASTLTGAGFGAWMATMIGVDVPNTRLVAFEDAIQQGAVLMMVDVAKDRVDEIDDLVKKHHPEAELKGAEPSIPEFP
ncbi:MAG: DUF1269 domain-containing protein [Gammaproteobacteria bacterium]|nr:DUF1269 domain-containing protein [Gammaproteobacteria bacterium]